MTNLQIYHITRPEHSIVDPQRAPALNFVQSNPCVMIGFYCHPVLAPNSVGRIHFDRVPALIDTGADGVYVDLSLIKKYNCPVALGGEAMTVNNAPGSQAYRGTLFIPEDANSIDMYVIGRDFAAERRPFKVVLGRRFLQFCELTWNGPRQKVELKVVPNPQAF